MRAPRDTHKCPPLTRTVKPVRTLTRTVLPEPLPESAGVAVDCGRYGLAVGGRMGIAPQQCMNL